MPISSFRQDFTDIQIAMYEDWKVNTKDVKFDRKNINGKWTFNNPVDQDVVIAVQAYSDRLFHSGCSVAAMQEMLSFQVTKNGR